MGNLKDLQTHKENILLAEVAAWLHDIGKFTKIHIQHHTNGPSRWGNGGSYKVIVNDPNTVISTSCSNSLLGNRIRQILSNRPPTFYTYLQSITPSGASNWEGLINAFQVNIGSSWRVSQLILLSPPGAVRPSAQGCFGSNGWLPAALGISHGIAHLDKQEGDGPQRWSDVRQSTAFGYETPIADIDFFLEKIFDSSWVNPSQNWLRFWKLTRHIISRAFVKGLGDTRRPMNEVTLQDWMWTVAALYKSTVSSHLLGIPFSIVDNRNHNLRWRLLSLRTDGLTYMLSAPSIPDLLARKELLTDAWNRVQQVLEEEYPLGLEVYRDENGPVFVVPDLDNLPGLENPDDNHKTLREYILEAFRQGTVKGDACLAIDGEVVPWVNISRAWSGQKDPNTGQLDLPPIGDMLEETPPLQSDPAAIAQAWCHHTEEICSICGLRPQGPGPKARRRKMCDICEERRADRAKAWAVNLGSTFLGTIWLDEVADANGRLALIVGQFDLTHWLDGTLVRSLAVRTPNDQNGHTEDDVAKNPSFARLRRIWETTRRFWQHVAPTDAPPQELQDFCSRNGLDIETFWEGPLTLEKSLIGEVVGKAGPRLLIHGALQLHKQGENPGPYHAYELRLGRVKIGVLWDPERHGFITLENLVYIARQLGHKPPKPAESREDEQEVEERESLHRWAAEVVRQEIQGQRLILEEPTGYGGRNREWGTIDIQEVAPLPQPYVPVVPILAEPRTFMALVPADKAIEVVRAIKAKYEREMGKVRNRLPLHLGIVFADAHQPLRTILDAGRRMLKGVSSASVWRVRNAVHRFAARDALPQRFQDDVQGQFASWVELNLERDGQQITWYVPIRMGDGQTPDFWYPYTFIPAQENHPPRDRAWFYKTRSPWNPQHPWVVHVSHLRWDDHIYFTPATFDFIWLDHGGTRFEIAYDQSGRRRGTLHRPYLLDELDDLVACWEMLKQGLGTRQIHQVRNLIETKRAEWFETPEASLKDATFEAFCRGVLTNAEWKPDYEPDLARFTHWAVTGLLADAVELFYHIMKQRPVGEEET